MTLNEIQMDYRQWKKNIPACYDFFVNNNLILPSPCIRWGHCIREDSSVLEQRFACSSFLCRKNILFGHLIRYVIRIYYTERGAEPNTIVIANVKINKPRTSDPTKMVCHETFAYSFLSDPWLCTLPLSQILACILLRL